MQYWNNHHAFDLIINGQPVMSTKAGNHLGAGYQFATAMGMTMKQWVDWLLSMRHATIRAH